ncbi:MAG: hypothetical protein GF399_04085 [Candidatus Coatesbacteria bacterium]|nr:hypothetical protein [Candidatus Coatesbacteria bacterium]
MLKRLIFLLLLLCLAARGLFVVGRLVDAATGKPVPEACVSIGDERTLSEPSGEFRLQFQEAGLLRVEAGRRFQGLALPLAGTRRLELALIPARLRIGEGELSFLDFFRDAARASARHPLPLWRHVWEDGPRVYFEEGLTDEERRAVRRAWELPELPALGELRPYSFTEDALTAQVFIRPGAGVSELRLSYDTQSGRPLGAVITLGAAEDEAAQARFLKRALLRLWGLNPLEREDRRGEYTVLGRATEFTRLDATALAVAARLSAGTNLGWYGPRLELDLRSRRLQVLVLPFAVTYDDPYMSHIAAATLAQTLSDYGPYFNLRLDDGLREMARLAAEERSPADELLPDEAYSLEAALALARERDCRYVVWGELANRSDGSAAVFYAADSASGRLIVDYEGRALHHRLHFPRFFARAGLELVRAVYGPPDVPPDSGTLLVHFDSLHASVYVHTLIDDQLVAVLSSSDNEVKLPLSPGEHRVEFVYYLPMRHLGCVAGIRAGSHCYSVEVESGRETSIATLFDLNPLQSERSWNYTKTRIFDSAGEIVSEDYSDLAPERDMWRRLREIVEQIRRAEQFE